LKRIPSKYILEERVICYVGKEKFFAQRILAFGRESKSDVLMDYDEDEVLFGNFSIAESVRRIMFFL